MFSFTNINDIRELGLYYEKHGEYPYYDEYMDIYDELNEGRKRNEPIQYPSFEQMSYTAQEFALYWIRRFVKGATINGVFYTGEHLYYLNACHIAKVESQDTGLFKDNTKKARKVGSRVTGFPDFWDEDYKYFSTCYIARYGFEKLILRDEYGNPTESNVEAYKRIYNGFDLGLIEDENNLSGGLNHLYLKPRGVGFSWKLGNWNNYNLYLSPKIENFIVADNSEYLGDKDGIMSKFNSLRSFTQDKIWFLRKNFYKASITEYSFATGFKESIGGTEIIKGFGSSVNGVVIDGNSDKLRGKRGNVSVEEFGSFPKVGDVWIKSMPAVNEYGIVYGQMRGGGTGGGSNEGYADLERMFYNPKDYDIIKFKNPFDDNYRGSGCGMFTPAYINITYKTKSGNSIIEESKEILEAEREEKKKSPDPTLYVKHCGEKPFKPSEAFNASGMNILPVELAKEQYNYLVQTNIDRTLCRYGDLEMGDSGIKFVPNPKLRPYEAYPVEPGDKEGCVVILKEPYKVDGRVPENLYTISVDPYSDEEATDSPSIGSFVVEEALNTLTLSKGDIEVCWYDGRPEGHDGQDRFCRRLFYAAELYNAKIVIENNQKGNIVHYAKTHVDSRGRKLTIYLEGQLALGYDIRIATKAGMKREYGVHITGERKLQGLKDYQENLLKPRGFRPDGSPLLNIHTNYNRGLLQEIIQYNGKNADRISCRIVRMFARKDFIERQKKIKTGKDNVDTFFSKPLFQ